jgi:hypothetical protein
LTPDEVKDALVRARASRPADLDREAAMRLLTTVAEGKLAV